LELEALQIIMKEPMTELRGVCGVLKSPRNRRGITK
jgi:hypothetical protein